MVDAFQENIITYANIMEGSRYSIRQYVNAVKYCSYKLMGYTNRDSYKMAFPTKYKEALEKYRALGFEDRFIWDYKISPQVVQYNGGKLVNAIMEQSIIPPHILNQGLYQEALNVSADLMRNAKSDFVKMTAADNIMSQLKPPEISKIKMDISYVENDAIKKLKEVTQELAISQRKAIESGAMSSKEIAETNILAEVEEVDIYDVEEIEE
jgi:hypothetical protein